MIIDLDSWFASEDKSVLNGRVFAHDVFICHRQHNNPKDLVDSLEQLGVQVIWDCNLDLRDRRVSQGISRAIRRSRFIVVYISNDYNDSAWCRSEYLNALSIEKQYKIQRTIVVCESSEAFLLIPESLLKSCSIIYNKENIPNLARHLIDGNTEEKDPDAERLAQIVPPDMLGISTDELSFDEQLYILEQRIEFWAKGGRINYSDKECTARVVGRVLGSSITEPEVICREMKRVVVRSEYKKRLELGERELFHVVAIANCIIKSYPLHLAELRAFEAWAYEFLLIPLLIAVEIKGTSFDALEAYRRLCYLLEAGDLHKEIPIYLDVLNDVVNGASVSDAVRRGYHFLSMQK